MKGFRSLRTHLVVVVLGLGLLVAVPLMVYGRWAAMVVTRDLARGKGLEQVEATVERLDSVLRRVEQNTVQLSVLLEGLPWSEETLEWVVCSGLKANADVFGSAVAVSEAAFSGRSLYAPYCYRTENSTSVRDLSQSYDYLKEPWFVAAVKARSPVWSEPYFDEGGGEILMATHSAPVWRAEGYGRVLAGVVTSDVALGDLQHLVDSIQVATAGYAFLTSQSGTLMACPDRSVVMRETVDSLARERHSDSLLEALDLLHESDPVVVAHRSLFTGDEGFLVLSRLQSTGWGVGIFFPREEVVAEISWLSTKLIWLGALGIVLVTAVVIFVAGTITRPLRQLAAFAATVGQGDLDAPPPATDRLDEVGRLGRSFGEMQGSLKKTLEERAEMAAARKQIDSELRIAREIQMNLMPTAPFGLDECCGLDVGAVLEPARQVGGDFFDVFPVGSNRICVFMGDVSGKGVPAALFMARASALLRTTAHEVADPARLMARVNHELSTDNDTYLFVTVFLALIETRTGESACVNAGHPAPIVLGPEGEVATWVGGEGLPLGLFSPAPYEVQKRQLGPGQTLVLYTDGVTEAQDQADRLFSEETLVRSLKNADRGEASAVVSSIMTAVANHRGAAAQSDDVAVLAIRRKGAANASGA